MTNIDAILKATEGHTPGPWEVKRNFDNDVDSIGPIEAGAEFAAHWWLVTGGPRNAALVSAAPALRAEVLRLREVEAAWSWLAMVWLHAYPTRRWVERYGVSMIACDGWIPADNMANVVASVPLVNGKPDPVALCDKLDANWRVK